MFGFVFFKFLIDEIKILVVFDDILHFDFQVFVVFFDEIFLVLKMFFMNFEGV